MNSDLIRNIRQLVDLAKVQTIEAGSVTGEERLERLARDLENVSYFLCEVQFKLEQGENHGNNEAE